MKQKTLALIITAIFLVGIVTAGTITNLSPSLDISNFIAGDTTSTEFSFDYPDVEGNYNNAPLVAKLNVISLDDEYLVWKGDFQFSMIATQYLFGGLLGDLIPYNTIPMTCSEDEPIQFKAKDKPEVQYTIDEVPNGTFYCYNPNYYIMQLDSHDDITLDISSNPALYPGEYNVTIELMEMEPDYEGPKIKLVKPSQDQIFSESNEIIQIKLNITDMYNIDDSSVKYKIVNLGIPSEGVGLNATYYDSGWISEIEYTTSEFYEAEFNMTEHNLTESGFYWIYAEAKDVLGNEGKL